MSKKLTIQSVNASREAAADAITKANEVRDALIARVRRDHRMALDLNTLYVGLSGLVSGDTSYGTTLPAEFRDQLEPTANSYGYTLVDHSTRRDLVSIVPLEQA